MVVLLALLGVTAAVLRIIYPDDFITRFEPLRQRWFEVLAVNDPFADQRPAELARIDGRFAAHRWVVLAHAAAGGLFLLAAPLQFSRRIRSRHLAWHRWSGRVLLLLGFPLILSALFFGVLMPYAGQAEALLILVIGALFLAAAAQAWLAIRRHDIARHREWMIRVFASAISISTVRVLGGPFDLALTPAGVHPRMVFLITIWVAWALTLGAAELWIRRGRQPLPLVAARPSH